MKWILLCVLLALAPMALATNFNPTKDSYTNFVCNPPPNKCLAHGAETAIYSAHTSNPFNPNLFIIVNAYLGFDLSSLGSSVNHAILNLTNGCGSVSGDLNPVGNNHSAYSIADSWTEATLTGCPDVSCPTPPAAISLIAQGSVTSGGSLILDVTTAVNSVLSGTKKFNAVVIETDSTSQGTAFCSEQATGADASKRPVLSVS
jgi:hypothetical protein